MDLSQHPRRAEFEVPRVQPLVPTGALVSAGTELGPLVGSAWGTFGAFFFQNPWTLLARREAMETLQQAGVHGLKGCKPELRFRQKKNPPDLVVLQLEPHGLLHPDCLPPRPPPCSRCERDGFRLPEHLILDKASLPTHTDVFRLSSASTVLVGSERFREAVQRLGLDGILFLELPLR